ADENNYTFDELLPLGSLEITVQLDKSPRKVTLQPANEPITEYVYKEGQLRFTLPKLELHDIIVIEP
ncbi:MAG: hypothetical protein JKX85_09415, partial [Phycisphaeraceae bacterium]|nr:hypothetical protein [Phycisphaeraceae bacterium]